MSNASKFLKDNFIKEISAFTQVANEQNYSFRVLRKEKDGVYVTAHISLSKLDKSKADLDKFVKRLKMVSKKILSTHVDNDGEHGFFYENGSQAIVAPAYAIHATEKVHLLSFSITNNPDGF